MSRLRMRLNEERGWGLVSSILVIGILLSLSLPLVSLVDTQQRQSAQERKSESSFNLAEAALDASVFVLGKQWPSAASGAYPSTCTMTSTTLRCPNPDLLTGTYSGGDYSNRAWSVEIRDDTGTEYYDPAVVPTRPTWDSNGNAKVWVRADAHAAEGERTIVALVKRLDRSESFPRNAITAGWFSVTNNGNKALVDTKGNAAQPAPVAVRCAEPAPSACLDYDPTRPHVSPDTTTPGYTGTTTIPPDSLMRFRTKAQALGTYYASGCPSDLTGELIFIESGSCSVTGSGDANSSSAPGALIVANGTLSFGGSFTYYGLVYAANLQHSAGIVVSLQGNAQVVGSIAVDGGGGVAVGSSGGPNMVFADGVFPSLTTFGGAAPVQGSWRELPAS